MPHMNSNRRNRATAAKPTAIAVLVLLLACLGLAACGSSGSSTTTSAKTSANAAATTASGGGTGATGARSGRFTALRECLQKNGITLPKRTPGQGPRGGAGGFFGGGAGVQLPNGVTRAQMQAALKKCGGGASAGLRRVNTPAFKQEFDKFVSCMRENGIDLPAPNTSGNGPIFNSKGLNTTSAKFRAAEQKCRADLPFPGRPGGGPSGASGAPPPGSSSGSSGASEPG
jgi:hypothetical protein